MDDLSMRAQEAMQNGRFEQALAYYEQAIAQSPGNASFRQGAAMASIKLGRPGDAIAWSRAALEIDPQLAMAHMILASAYNLQNEIPMSREEAKIAYDLAPESAEILNTYAALLILDHKPAAALPILEKAISIDPNLYKAYHNLMIAYRSQRNARAIFRCAKKIYTLRPSLPNAIRVVFAAPVLKPLAIVAFVVTLGAILYEIWSLVIITFLFYAIVIAASEYMERASRKER